MTYVDLIAEYCNRYDFEFTYGGSGGTIIDGAIFGSIHGAIEAIEMAETMFQPFQTSLERPDVGVHPDIEELLPETFIDTFELQPLDERLPENGFVCLTWDATSGTAQVTLISPRERVTRTLQIESAVLQRAIQTGEFEASYRNHALIISYQSR